MRRLIKPLLLTLAAIVACVAFGWQLTVITEQMAETRGEANSAQAR